MKTNPNDSINSLYGYTYTEANGFTKADYINAGLTKREYFAAMAMQGFCVNSIELTHETAAILAVNQADALIEALNTKG